MNRNLVITFALLIITAGCGGNGNNPDPQPAQSGVDPVSLGQASDQRLDPAPTATDSGVIGEITIEEFTVIDENQDHVQLGDEGFKMHARLIDPTDDILSATIADNSGQYQLLTTTAAIDAKIQVEIMVAEDIDGDGEGNDTIIQAVPVKLVPGKLARVNLTISPGSVHEIFDAILPISSTGTAVVVSIERYDGNGFLDEFYASFPEGLVYFDDNNDGFIEPGEDTFYEDSDRNGWPDPVEQDFGEHQGNPIYLNGSVVNFNEADRTIIVRVASATIVGENGEVPQTQLVDTNIIVELIGFTPTEILGTAPTESGQIDPAGFTGEFGLNISLIGQEVYVEGDYDGTRVKAELVLQTPKPPAGVSSVPFNQF